MVIEKYVALKRSDIFLFQFILEGYEDLVTVTTEDPRIAMIKLSISPDFGDDVDAILFDLRKIIAFREIHYDLPLQLKEES